MGKTSENNKIEVVSEAIKVSIGAFMIAAILYFVDVQFGFLKTLDINQYDVKMIAFSALGFSCFWVIMHKWFFAPYMDLFEKREKLTVGSEDNLKQKQNEIAEMMEQYEIKTLQVRAEEIKKKSDLLLNAKNESAKQIESAKLAAQESIANAKKDLNSRIVDLKNDANKQAQVLAEQMVNKILSEKNLIN